MTRRCFTLLLLLAGCGWQVPQSPPPVNECESDADCTVGRCDPRALMCVSDPPAPLRVGLEIRPTRDPHSGTPAVVTLPPFDVMGSTERDLMLPPALTVVGTLRVPGHTTPEDVRAELTFTTASAYGGAPIRVTVRTFDDPMMIGEVNADFAVRLLSGVEYDVVVQPTGESARDVPPYRLTLTTPVLDPTIAGGFNVYPWDVIYPPDLPVVTGTLFSILPGEMDPQNEGNLTVRAIEAETGRIVSSTAISSSGAGDPAERGRFTIQISPGVESIFLRVGPSEDRPFPTVDINPTGIFATGDPILLRVPRLEIGCFRGRVEAHRVRTPVSDAFVTFHAAEVTDRESGLSGSFTAHATSGSDGYFEVPVPMTGALITYDVTVTPTTGEEHATLLTSQDVSRGPDSGGCAMGQTFELPPRASLGGLVRTPAPEEEVPNVTVEGQPRELPVGMPGNQIVARVSSGLTDGNGQYSLRLDIGAYDILVKPPVESGYPWRVSAFEYAIEDPTMPPDDLDFTIDHQLEPPVTMSGIVRDAAGDPVPAADVLAFGIVRTMDGDRTVPIAQTTTGSDGRYFLLLPPSF